MFNTDCSYTPGTGFRFILFLYSQFQVTITKNIKCKYYFPVLINHSLINNYLCFPLIFEQAEMKKTDYLHPYGKKQLQYDIRYLQMAMVWAKNSYCKRRQVGALIVKEKMIISDGYNGTPSGFENECEDVQYNTKPYVLHAEANAITKVAKSNNSSENATLYITTAPCMECAKLIIQSGIRRVVFCNNYHTEDGVVLLERAGIEVKLIETEDIKKIEDEISK